MGRPKGGTNKYWSADEKYKIIKPIIEFEKSSSQVTKETGISNGMLSTWIKKYKDKKTMLNHATKYIDEIIPLFDIPINIKKYIYTNNIVESVNSKVQRGFYGRGALPNTDSAINIIYVNLIDLENKWKKTKVQNWDKIFKEIQIVHKDILEKYIKN